MIKKKSYKTMSVSELVAARKELIEKTYQIDCILNTAAEAVKSSTSSLYSRNSSLSSSNDSPFQPRYTDKNQVTISTEAPSIPRVAPNSLDQSSGFSVFDADSYVSQQLQQDSSPNPDLSSSVEFDFNSLAVSSEIESLKQDISTLSS